MSLLYDSVGSIDTPKEYFQRLRDGGITVAEFNPVNPLKAKKGWELNERDHRKLLIVDGRVGFVGGINISGVYSSGSATLRNRTPEKARQARAPVARYAGADRRPRGARAAEVLPRSVVEGRARKPPPAS